MVCGNLFPCRVQIPQWPCNDEMATRNRHVHVLGQVHRVRCNDASSSRNLLAKALAQVFPKQLVANAGYGAECVPELCRERWRVSSWIPLAVRSGDGQVRGRWRSRMREMPKVYRQRWHVGSFLSGLKRTTGSQLTAWREKMLNNNQGLVNRGCIVTAPLATKSSTINEFS